MARKPSRPPTDIVGRMIEHLESMPDSERPDRRSELFRLMHSRMDKFEIMTKKRTWSALAESLNAQGMRGGRGEPLTAERVRKTWWLVRDFVKTEREKAENAGKPKREMLPLFWPPGTTSEEMKAWRPAPGPAALASGALPIHAPQKPPEDYWEPPPRTFKHATLRGMPMPAKSSGAPDTNS